MRSLLRYLTLCSLTIKQIRVPKPATQTNTWLYVIDSYSHKSLRNMSSDDESLPSKGPSPKATRPPGTSGPQSSSSSSGLSPKYDQIRRQRASSLPENVANLPKPMDIFQEKEKYLSMDIESKRKLYNSTYITLEDIKTWPDYFSQNMKGKVDETTDKAVQKEVRKDLNKRVSLFQGDITTLEIDVITNAANESLLGGGGVDGAIHRAAGHLLKVECETLNRCNTGDAKMTCGYNLPAKYIIHAVGPMGEIPTLLASCYKRSLELMKENNLKSIAFPCISTGIFGYPNLSATKVALETIREWLENDSYAGSVERIILCLFLPVDIDAYEKLMPQYFPLETNRYVNRGSSSGKEE